MRTLFYEFSVPLAEGFHCNSLPLVGVYLYQCIVCLCIRPDDGETEASAGCAKLSQFFAPKTGSQPARKRHRYFEERGLKTFSRL